MELKPNLTDYTAAQFQELVNRIWAVDVPQKDHNRLIDHFDQIVGHPNGADLLFSEEESGMSQGPETVVHHVRQWHRSQGLSAFKDEGIHEPPPPVRATMVQRSLADAQKIAADLAAADLSVEQALGGFERGVQHMRSVQGVTRDVWQQENDIRTLEQAQHDAYICIQKYGFLKMRIKFAKTSALQRLRYSGAEQNQWHDVAQHLNATHDRYTAQLATIQQSHRALHDEAEALLVAAQQVLISARALAGSSPTASNHQLHASLLNAGKRPELLMEGEVSALAYSQQVDLQKSIRSAVAEFAWRNTAVESTSPRTQAAVLQFEFASRADVKVYGLSVPLSEFMPVEGLDWQAVAANRSELALPFRMGPALTASKPGSKFMGLREVALLEQLHVTAAKGTTSASKVRVRRAERAGQPGTYRFTSDGAAGITVLWSVANTLDKPAPSAPGFRRQVGFVYSSPVPTLEPAPDAEENSPDYIVVFPGEAGLDPLYVVLTVRNE
ncbi:bacteriocin immunity protein [Pseudomonas sp. S2_C03]